ncbi:hypothetical protein EDB81DRAFT_932277 [Dactylonectria macrodidyma]|uniref:Peptidase metallopeptidase domain-containing protein n=1 Tax=Dactylonectria macrodidyma TaxID=307937 RepID=A0A9P9F391_9HYPO|nr:hypothetical protein EDB81DRAFT_932277 [Dactylonectria macrodidyma]
MENIRFCTQIPVPPELQAEADMLSVQANPLNGHQITTGGLLPGLGGMESMAMPVGWMWKNGQTLRVKFLNGSEIIKSKIRLYANLWTEYANINFDFVDSGDAEIRINIDSSNASNSLIGTNNLIRKDQSVPTMNFGWLKDTSTDPEFCSVILHEFGHALGLVHEHQSPGVEIKWNKPVVYEYYWEIDHWDHATVDANLFFQYDKFSTYFTTFDPLSIMVYELPKQFTLDGFSVGANVQLSDTDKSFIGTLYPRKDIDVASFNTLEVRPADQPAQEAEKTELFSREYDQPPSLALGLTWLEVASGANVRVTAFADNIANSSADVHINTWSNTALYSAGCTWLRKASNDPQFQMGQFSTQDDHPWQDRQVKTSRQITFDRPYDETPNVIIWLNQLDISYNTVWNVRATATDVTSNGFTINIDSSDDTWLCSATAAWIAYPPSMAGVASGSYDTTSVRPESQPQLNSSGRVDFPAGAFSEAPKVLIALNSLNVDNRQNLRLKVSADSISEEGMNWHIDSWGDTTLYSAGASYIALG